MSNQQKRAFLALLAVGFAATLWIISPIWTPLFLGTMIAVVCAPSYARHRGRRPGLLAAGYTAAVLLVLTLVIGGLLYIIARDLLPMLQDAVTTLRASGVNIVYKGAFGHFLHHLGYGPHRLADSLGRLSEAAATRVGGLVTEVLTLTTEGVLGLMFTALASYYLLVDGKRLLAFGERVSPLPPNQTRALFREFRDTVRGTLVGTGIVGFFQGGIAMLGYWILHVPHALMWGALTGVGSLVPGLGTALVWAPLGVILVAIGHTAQGIAVLGFGAIVIVAAADYVLRPLVVGGQVRLHVLLVFISIFGGLEVFGLLGLVLGPLLMSLFVSLLRIYDREYRPERPPRLPGPPPRREGDEPSAGERIEGLPGASPA